MPRTCPSECPTAPIVEIFCGKFGTEGSSQVDRPTGAPVSRREQDDELATGGRGRLYDERALVSVDLEQSTANR